MARTIVVSGGGTGIGQAIAQHFAACGDDVLILGRREQVLQQTAEQINATGHRVRWAKADLTQPDQIESVLAASLPAEQSVDVLVNNAGGLRAARGESLAAAATQWMEMFQANVLSAALLTIALTPRMIRPGGRSITISSIAALRGGGESYAASKAALHGWTYTLAADLGPHGITANIVAPGFIDNTELFGDMMTSERRQRLIGQTPLGRAGHPGDVAGAVGYLASDAASYITGQVLQVNGGALLGR